SRFVDSQRCSRAAKECWLLASQSIEFADSLFQCQCVSELCIDELDIQAINTSLGSTDEIVARALVEADPAVTTTVHAGIEAIQLGTDLFVVIQTAWTTVSGLRFEGGTEPLPVLRIYWLGEIAALQQIAETYALMIGEKSSGDGKI